MTGSTQQVFFWKLRISFFILQRHRPFIDRLCDGCDILRGDAGLQSLALSATLMAM